MSDMSMSRPVLFTVTWLAVFVTLVALQRLLDNEVDAFGHAVLAIAAAVSAAQPPGEQATAGPEPVNSRAGARLVRHVRRGQSPAASGRPADAEADLKKLRARTRPSCHRARR
jgi:hypothetical protein